MGTTLRLLLHPRCPITGHRPAMEFPSATSTGVSLDTLSFDIVLRIFHYLSAHDIVRTCQVGLFSVPASGTNDTDDPVQACKSLRTNLEEHHVWLELAERCCSKSASVARHILPLTARSTDELRAFVAGQAKLDRHWVKETILTNPLVRFKFQTSTPSVFCELLPGGEYLALVHLNGDVSLLSLVDLDNVHEISKLSISHLTRNVHTVPMATDHEGRTLLILSTYGSPRRYLRLLDSRCVANTPKSFLYSSRDRNEVHQHRQMPRD